MVFRELLEIAMQYHNGDTEKARGEVLGFMEDVKGTLSEAERELFSERSGMFIADGYNEQEADAAALDMIIKQRPRDSAIGGRREALPGQDMKQHGNAPINPSTRRIARNSGLEGLRTFAKREWKQ